MKAAAGDSALGTLVKAESGMARSPPFELAGSTVGMAAATPIYDCILPVTQIRQARITAAIDLRNVTWLMLSFRLRFLT